VAVHADDFTAFLASRLAAIVPAGYARIHDAALHLGYGDPGAPVLACTPIPLTPQAPRLTTP